jgi:hypothetical protein
MRVSYEHTRNDPVSVGDTQKTERDKESGEIGEIGSAAILRERAAKSPKTRKRLSK